MKLNKLTLNDIQSLAREKKLIPLIENDKDNFLETKKILEQYFNKNFSDEEIIDYVKKLQDKIIHDGINLSKEFSDNELEKIVGGADIDAKYYQNNAGMGKLVGGAFSYFTPWGVMLFIQGAQERSIEAYKLAIKDLKETRSKTRKMEKEKILSEIEGLKAYISGKE